MHLLAALVFSPGLRTRRERGGERERKFEYSKDDKGRIVHVFGVASARKRLILKSFDIIREAVL